MKWLLLSAIILCWAVVAAPAKPQHSGAACDFSGDRPLIVSRPPRNAVMKRVEPKYPGAAMTVRRPSSLKVRIKILVDRSGNVVRACAVRGYPLLREAARQAVTEWKFKPNFGLRRRIGRDYIQSWVDVVFRFNQLARTPNAIRRELN